MLKSSLFYVYARLRKHEDLSLHRWAMIVALKGIVTILIWSESYGVLVAAIHRKFLNP